MWREIIIIVILRANYDVYRVMAAGISVNVNILLDIFCQIVVVVVVNAYQTQNNNIWNICVHAALWVDFLRKIVSSTWWDRERG